MLVDEPNGNTKAYGQHGDIKVLQPSGSRGRRGSDRKLVAGLAEIGRREALLGKGGDVLQNDDRKRNDGQKLAKRLTIDD